MPGFREVRGKPEAGWLPATARTLACAIAAALACSACSGDVPATPSVAKPNIVMILADDHGYPDFGFMGSEFVKTPRIDELARGGVVFPVTYNTASWCRPSLQTLLTGLYPHQYRRAQLSLRTSEKFDQDGSEIEKFATLPRLLQERGYASFQAGKLWEGSFAMAGFSEGTKTEIAAEVPGLAWAGGKQGLAIGRETMEPVFDFIDRHLEQPFFLWFAPQLPHMPFDPPEEFVRPYMNIGLGRSERLYFGNVTRFDAVVGQLVDHLEKRGLRENTLIVFLSDNGWEPDSSQLYGRGLHGKRSYYELGLRTPMIFNWPGHIKDGRVDDGVVSTVSLFRTLLDFAGYTEAEGARLQNRSGPSLRARIAGEGSLPGDRVIGRLSGLDGSGDLASDSRGRLRRGSITFFLRDAKWHYIWAPSTGRDLLFDIERDPRERRDVSAEHPELTADLQRAINAWDDEHDGPVTL